MEEDNNAKNSIHFFFRSMGLTSVILGIRIKIIYGVSIISIKALWYTFLYIFMEVIWFGLALMFIVDLYKYIKNKLL